MKSFQVTKAVIIFLAGSVVAISTVSTLINCGSNDNGSAPGLNTLSINGDGTCSPRLKEDMKRYIKSCSEFSDHDRKDNRTSDKLSRVAEDCNRFTQFHRQDVVCNLNDLPDLDDSDVRRCISLSGDETAPNGILKFRAKGIHEFCRDITSTNSDLIMQGPPPGFSEDKKHRSHRDDDRLN